MQAKINTAYHYGNEKGSGGGLSLAKQAVSELLDLPVHYVAILDFRGFVKAIDAVGGIDVEVDSTFDDYKYPIAGKENVEPESDRYEHVHFDKGMTHMDGATALKFARSRHSVGDEGTDFARGKRQEKIVIAFRNKVFSTNTLFNSTTLSNLKESISSSIDTDIGPKEQASFFKLFLNLGSLNNVNSIDIADFFTNPKSTTIYGGQWVLIPKNKVENIHVYVKEELAK
jgi:LCP family protein required for cell wall assembly